MIINHNMASLNTYNKLSANTTNTAKSLEKLSSGLRINKAGDDAAGLAISEKMRGQIRGLDQASRNAQDGISLIQTAEGSLSETQSILQRMKELATQAANDTNVTGDRTEIQKEINQLSSEINRIGNTTEFNTQKLLKGKDVAVIETAVTATTTVPGVAGVAAGEISPLTTNATSIKGVTSQAAVQASTSKATGTISDVVETTQSIKGVKSSVTVPNGITFQAAQNGTAINNMDVTLLQSTTAGAASKLEVDGDGNYTFTIGQTAGGESLAQTRGALYNELKSAIDNYDSTTGFTDANEITVLEPTNTSEAVSSLNNTGGSFAGGVTEQKGKYDFTISEAFKEAGDTVTIDGQKFTAVLNGADATKGQFNIGNIEATLTGGEAYGDVAAVAGLAVDAKVDISLGGTTYSLSKAALEGVAGNTSADIIAAVGAATTGTVALSTVADITISDGKLVITAKDPQTTPVTWTASSGTDADVKEINDAFGMETVASVGSTAVADLTEDLNGRAAVWDTGVVAAQADTTSTDFIFNGVTITVTTGAAVAAAVTGAKSASISIANSATDAQTATALMSAIAAYKANATGTGDADGSLDNFTFGGDENGITITSANAGASALEITGDIDIANSVANSAAGAAQAAGTMGTDSIDESASVVINVDGTDFTIDSQALKAALNSDSGAYTAATVKSVLENAKDANGHLLSEVAVVSDPSVDPYTITSRNLQPTSEVTVSYNSDVTGEMTRLEDLFNIDNYVTDKGADAVSSSRTVTDQAKSLTAAIEANATLGARFQYGVTSGGSVTLTETNNQATGEVLTDPVVAGSGSNDKLIVSNTGGQNLNTITIERAEKQDSADATAIIQSNGEELTIKANDEGTRANGIKVVAAQNASDDLNVAFKDGTLTINLATTTQADNSMAAIQTAIQDLGTIDGIDFSTWTVSDDAGGAGNNWNTQVASNDIEIKNATFSGGQETVTENQLNVSVDQGNLTIHLAADSVRDNTAAKIQDAVQELGEFSYFNENDEWTSIDFSKFEFTTEGDWDTATLGNNISKDSDTLVGGTKEQSGNYSYTIDKAFVVGDKVEVSGQVFTAVESGAVASKGQFNVGGGNLNTQAAGLIDAINLNTTLKPTYTASASGNKITLVENAATGVDLTNDDLDVRATGRPGEFTIAAPALLDNGSKFILDGEEIAVSNKNTNSGYSDGTAVKEAASLADQSTALANAINTNATLSVKYTATAAADGSITLKQTDDFTTDTTPTVSTRNSSIGDFTSTFQVGANSGQSMKIEVGDMRAASLGVTGDGTATTVTANNGAVASYVSTATVTDGTTDTNTEFALDVSTHEKATAAIGVLDDALAAVSAQRSQLGAFQNRLEHTITNLGTSSENLTGAESRIRDVDMAKEMMQFQKNNILAQAATAMLAQANQQPQGVLQLLR